MKRYGSNLPALTILVLTAGSAAAAETRYTVTDLGSLSGPVGNSWALAVNASGQVVGGSYAPVDIFPYSFAPHAYLYEDGQMSDLGTLDGGLSSVATAINASGEVVGTSDAPGTPGLAFRAFLYSGGVMTRIDPFGNGQSAAANGIDDAGQVVGWARTLGGVSHAFLYSGGLPAVDLHASLPAGATNSVATAINNTGAVVGAYGTNDGDHGFIYRSGFVTILPWSADFVVPTALNDLDEVVGIANAEAFLYRSGEMTLLGTLGGPKSRAFGINRSGQVVGYSDIEGVGTHAFLYSNGIMRDLNQLLPPGSGAELLEARGINDAGQIVGVGNIDGQPHAFLLSPARPERLIGDLIAMVHGLGLPNGIENSFVVKLEHALTSLAAGDTASACDELGAFVNQVHAQAGKALTTQEAEDLVAAAEQIRSMLGCP